MELDTALAIPDPAAPADMELIALTPSDLLAAQTNLVNWCDGKVAAIRTELAELRENLRIAKESKWKHTTLAATVNRTAKRITFYEKIKEAVAAGYLIVPNFPIDVFAVRVRRETPPQVTHDYRYSRHEASAELLPAGEGRYVDHETVLRDDSYTTKTEDGKGTKEVVALTDIGYDDVAFPVQAVKPVILDATQRAMGLRLFDEMGIVRNERKHSDPIVVGRLLDPRGQGRVVTFFVAWWLNTNTL